MSKISLGEGLSNYNERYASIRLDKNIVSEFKSKLISYKSKIDTAISNGENEEYIKNIINNFLKDNFYSDSDYELNTSKYIDSTIRINGEIYAIIEAKKPTNIQEMINENNINKKALWEIIFYFLKSTRDVTSSKLRHIHSCEIKSAIITDGYKWFIIDSTELEKVCNGYLERQYYKYKNNKLTYANDNSRFYEEIESYLQKSDVTNHLNFLFFDLSVTELKTTFVSQVYKILSKEYLLKSDFRVDLDTQELNDGFYQELLYIMGFKEKKTKTSTIIEIDNDIKNTFAEQVYRKYISDKELDEETATDKTFELVIIWLNRLLFIKLFEGQLMSFNSVSNDYRILDNQKIANFQNLQDLFFNVLGRRNRTEEEFYLKFKEIPYLNSSLFERQEIERSDININELQNAPVLVKKHSVLKNLKKASLNILEYLLNFLNSYTFASMESDNGTGNEIINSNVLGLIFEKINGYKDGAVFTPSQITEYMCRSTIEQAIINKINDHFSWNCLSLDDIKFNIKSLSIAKEINDIIDSIKICDPAVGSGHFLVSALNRIIATKYYLGVLFKHNKNERLDEVDIFVDHDSLCVISAQGQPFTYDKNNVLSQNIQMTLFNEKRKVIENCLFGVDLNAKAVYICQLRLWIELLKNAYYENGVMQTLPNIDINIKTGNSLISRVSFNVGSKTGDLDFDLSDDKSIAKTFKDYRKAVKDYKSISDKKAKQEVIKQISYLKVSIYDSYAQMNLLSDYAEQQSAYDVYTNAFEWAFEFPEIINPNGTFEGFDIIVENPPYGMINKKQNNKVSISASSSELDYYKTQKQYSAALGGQINIFRLFICRSISLLKNKGLCTFIFPLSFACDASCSGIRDYIFRNETIRYLEVFPERDNAKKRVFKEAKMSVCILAVQKIKPTNNQTINMRINTDKYVNPNCEITEINLKNIDSIDAKYRSIPLVNQTELKLLNKITENSKKLVTYSKCYTGEIDISIDREFISNSPDYSILLRGAQVQKYRTTNEISQGNLIYLKSDSYLAKKGNSDKASHHNYPRIIMQGITGVNEKYRLKMTLISANEYCANSVNYIMYNDISTLKYLLGLLNSNLMEWYFSKLSTNSNVNGYEVDNLPIKMANDSDKFEIVKLVDICLSNQHNDEMRTRINELVYSIYGLNSNEIELIESYFS